jgi:hypothetical protein
VVIVWRCDHDVDTYVAAGREVEVPRADCPACMTPMLFWSGYERYLRHLGATARIWIRRARCKPCAVSHALIPSFVLLRRLDSVGVIGASVAKVIGAGRGVRPVAEEAGVPHTTARDWCRRFRSLAPVLAAGFAALAVELGSGVPPVAATAGGCALVAMAAAWTRARSGSGRSIPALWPFVGLVAGGGLLAATTHPPWAAAAGRRFIPPVPQTGSRGGDRCTTIGKKRRRYTGSSPRP